jgi:hypothetical protein
MKSKPILLTIIFWCEIIVSARVLVFTIPVLFSSYSQGSLSLVSLEGLSVVMLTLIALYYFMTGLASVMGFRGWRLFHYLGTMLTLALVFSLIKRAVEFGVPMNAGYYIPVVISAALSVFVGMNKQIGQRSAPSSV